VGQDRAERLLLTLSRHAAALENYRSGTQEAADSLLTELKAKKAAPHPE